MPIPSAFQLVMGLGQICLEPGGQRQVSAREIAEAEPRQDRSAPAAG